MYLATACQPPKLNRRWSPTSGLQRLPWLEQAMTPPDRPLLPSLSCAKRPLLKPVKVGRRLLPTYVPTSRVKLAQLPDLDQSWWLRNYPKHAQEKSCAASFVTSQKTVLLGMSPRLLTPPLWTKSKQG